MSAIYTCLYLPTLLAISRGGGGDEGMDWRSRFGWHWWEAMACDGAGRGQGAVAPGTRVVDARSPEA